MVGGGVALGCGRGAVEGELWKGSCGRGAVEGELWKGSCGRGEAHLARMQPEPRARRNPDVDARQAARVVGRRRQPAGRTHGHLTDRLGRRRTGPAGGHRSHQQSVAEKELGMPRRGALRCE